MRAYRRALCRHRATFLRNSLQHLHDSGWVPESACVSSTSASGTDSAPVVVGSDGGTLAANSADRATGMAEGVSGDGIHVHPHDGDSQDTKKRDKSGGGARPHTRNGDKTSRPTTSGEDEQEEQEEESGHAGYLKVLQDMERIGAKSMEILPVVLRRHSPQHAYDTCHECMKMRAQKEKKGACTHDIRRAFLARLV
jgi:hypothetical protein